MRAPRSDAAANRERLLSAAADAIARGGGKVPMAAIAASAGLGTGTLYRHFPTREALLAGLERRSYLIVLDHAHEAADCGKPGIDSLGLFFERTIERRHELMIMPLGGGPVSADADSVALRTEISDTLGLVFARGREDGTIRADATALDAIITGALLAHSLPQAPEWDRIARRQARIFLAGLSADDGEPLQEPSLTRAQLEESFAASRRSPRRR